MRFTSDKKGSILTAVQFFAIGLVLFLPVTYFLPILGVALIFIWAALCVMLYYRLRQMKATCEKNILRVEKGKWFPLVLRVPITYITGVHILQTPIARKLGVCIAVVYTSGLTFVLLGIKYSDAESIAALASRGGSTQ